MAQVPESTQLKSGFFHSLDITATEQSQFPFESLYKGAHNINAREVFGELVPYAVDIAQADLNVLNNPTIIKKYTQVPLTEIPGSNKQAWYLEDAGTFIRHWISPQDVPHSITADPSYGYQAQLYKEGGGFITPTEGVWFCRYSSGIVHFAPGYTPDVMGYGIPKITCFVYVGKSIYDIIGGGGIPEAPNDGKLYVRSGMSWKSILDIKQEQFTVTSPFVAGEIINTSSGLGSIGGVCSISGSVLLPPSRLSFESFSAIQIFRNGLSQNKKTDILYIDDSNLQLETALEVGETLTFQTASLY